MEKEKKKTIEKSELNSGHGITFNPCSFFPYPAGPAYPVMPQGYSQAVYSPGQPAYPPHPPAQPQPIIPSTQTDFLAQPAYNPDFVAPPPKTE